MVTLHLPWKFHANRSSRFFVILLTKKQTNKETKKSIENNTQSPDVSGTGNNVGSAWGPVSGSKNGNYCRSNLRRPRVTEENSGCGSSVPRVAAVVSNVSRSRIQRQGMLDVMASINDTLKPALTQHDTSSYTLADNTSVRDRWDWGITGTGTCRGRRLDSRQSHLADRHWTDHDIQTHVTYVRIGDF